MSYLYVSLFTNAIVVALMAMYVYENERRMGQTLAKLDRTGIDHPHIAEKVADKVVELLSNRCGCKQDKESNNENKDLEEEKGQCKGIDHPHIAEKVADKVVELLSNRCGCKQDKESNNENKDLEEEKGQCKVKRPSDCMDLDKSTCKNGIYTIYPENTSSFNVFCEMEEHGGGWTVFQRRINGNINFYRDWESYKSGFGNMNGEYWLGNEHLHQLTSQGKYILRIDMSDFENSKRHAVYSKFSVGSETSGYKLDVTGYSGDAGDAMKVHHNGNTFSTFDKDNKGNCAVTYKGGWWYGGCHHSNLNGLYLKGRHNRLGEGVNWYQWKSDGYSLKTTIMMIRRI